jgi:hypothetical protein
MKGAIYGARKEAYSRADREFAAADRGSGGERKDDGTSQQRGVDHGAAVLSFLKDNCTRLTRIFAPEPFTAEVYCMQIAAGVPLSTRAPFVLHSRRKEIELRIFP